VLVIRGKLAQFRSIPGNKLDCLRQFAAICDDRNYESKSPTKRVQHAVYGNNVDIMVNGLHGTVLQVYAI
jgi:hypothetical protein